MALATPGTLDDKKSQIDGQGRVVMVGSFEFRGIVKFNIMLVAYAKFSIIP